MADLSDVSNGLAALIGTTLYPDGTAAASLTGDAAKIMVGWPDAEQLKRDMSAQGGPVSVSIFATRLERVLPLLMLQWVEESVDAASITLTLAAQTLTVGGSLPQPFTAHNLALLANGLAFVYPVQPTDTLTSMASGFAAVIAQGIPGTKAVGRLIFLPATARPIAARVGVNGRVALPVRRQQRTFQITVWANRPDVRDRVGGVIDAALSGTYRLPLPDGSIANLAYASSTQDDGQQKQTTYRRDLFYAADYQTIQFATATQITQVQTDESATPDGSTIENAAVTLIS